VAGLIGFHAEGVKCNSQGQSAATPLESTQGNIPALKGRHNYSASIATRTDFAPSALIGLLMRYPGALPPAFCIARLWR